MGVCPNLWRSWASHASAHLCTATIPATIKKQAQGDAMLNLWDARRVVVVGGGTAGWFAALEMRRLFGRKTEVMVVESERIGILGAGEGSLPNFDPALRRYG